MKHTNINKTRHAGKSFPHPHTHFLNEIDAYEGNVWLGMFFATIAGLIVAVIIIGTLMATFDALTGWGLHEVIADWIA
jgi:hypothetical protein